MPIGVDINGKQKKSDIDSQREVRLSDSSAKEYLPVEFFPHSVAISFA